MTISRKRRHEAMLEQGMHAGNTDAKFDPPTVRTSFVLDGTCRTCEALAKGEMCPPHDPSPRCESGKRPHCTCDICF